MTKKHFIDMADRLVRLHDVMPTYEFNQVRSEMRSFCATHGKNFSKITFDNYIDTKIAANELVATGQLP